MKEPRLSKKKFEKQLLAYGVAAGATLAMASPASARIIWSGNQNATIPVTLPTEFNAYSIDINGDGAPEFQMAHHRSVAPTSWSSNVCILPAGMVGPGRWIRDGSSPANLNYGATIGPGLNWVNRGASMDLFRLVQATYLNHYGNFMGPDGYLGIRFDISGGTHYGWIYMDTIVSGDGINPGNLRVVSWAYETLANASITAGEQVHAPIPSGLLLLATGVVGLAAIRRRNLEKEQG
jgi:hypothetical protein